MSSGERRLVRGLGSRAAEVRVRVVDSGVDDRHRAVRSRVAVRLPDLRSLLQVDGVRVRRRLRRDRVDLLHLRDALKRREVRDLRVDRDAGERRMRLVEHMRAARQRRDHVALRGPNRRKLVPRGRARCGLAGVAERVVRHSGRLGLELEQEGVAALRGHAFHAARQRAACLGERNVTFRHCYALRERPPRAVLGCPSGRNPENDGSRSSDGQKDECFHSPCSFRFFDTEPAHVDGKTAVPPCRRAARILAGFLRLS